MKSLGYTLIELLVVISILALLTVVTFVNFRGFREDQSLVRSAADLASALKVAQNNANTNFNCLNFGVKSWFSQISMVNSKYQIDTICEYVDGTVRQSVIKTTTFDSWIVIDSIRDGNACVNFPTNAVTVSFALLSQGQNKIIVGSCNNGNNLTITLRNSNSSPNCTGINSRACKQVIINKGGSINVE